MKLPRVPMPRWASISLEALLVIAIFFGLGAYRTRNHVAGAPAPAFALADLSGRRVALSQYRGKKVLVHFFATWCGVCKLELASLRSLQRNLAPDEVLLGVVEDSDDVEAVRRFAREHELSYPILLGTPETRRAYRVDAFPTNYYVNGDGSVSSTSVGLSTRLGMASRLLMTRAGE